MSYARWSEMSDVYLYESASTGRFICCGCSLIPVPKPKAVGDFYDVSRRSHARQIHDERSTVSRSFARREQLIEHLQEHIAAGDKVEPHAILKLQHEIDNPEDFDPTRRTPKSKRPAFEKLSPRDCAALLIANHVLATEDPPPAKARLAMEVIKTAMDDLNALGDLGPALNDWKSSLLISLGVQLAHVLTLVPS